jgi:hypothetical protein
VAIISPCRNLVSLETGSIYQLQSQGVLFKNRLSEPGRDVKLFMWAHLFVNLTYKGKYQGYAGRIKYAYRRTRLVQPAAKKAVWQGQKKKDR